MALFSLFAGLGLALAMAGIFSVLSYLVSMRTREIGVRMAMGARPRDILSLIFRAGGKLVGVGVVIGILASLGVGRLLSNQLSLFQVTGFDPVSFLGVVILLGLVTAAACLIPARRATKVDPVVALRQD
jgi:ABC-type antimicrobial peptide transport system permease subunit